MVEKTRYVNKKRKDTFLFLLNPLLFSSLYSFGNLKTHKFECKWQAHNAQMKNQQGKGEKTSI